MERRIRRIAIVGGGIAGWLAAVTLSRRLGGQASIHVVDSGPAMTVGVAEATLPPVLEMLRFLGIDQNDFIDKTQSTYRFGTRFLDWAGDAGAHPGSAFWHVFGALGALIDRRPFQHFWHKARAQGLQAKLELFSTEAMMADAGRFIFPTNSLGVATNLRYALHVDAALAARYLRTAAERAGVIRLDRKVVSGRRAEDGRIEELQFEDGGSLRADLYLDCSGSRAQLIGEIMGHGFEDWSRWLPCNRVLTAPAALEATRRPYVENRAHAAGWAWRTALQNTSSHGFVYSSAHLDDDAALAQFRGGLGALALAEPERREFTSGRRAVSWDRNVVAIGGAGAALEPLAASELHLAGNALFNLLDSFPDTQFDPANVASYNAVQGDELERIRDFLILHYSLARRDDSPFWKACAAAEPPASLAQRLALYRATGRLVQRTPEQFNDIDWFWILEGMGVVPRDYDPLVDTVDFEQVKRLMLAISQKVSSDVSAAPTHDSFFAAANQRLAGARRTAGAASPAG